MAINYVQQTYQDFPSTATLITSARLNHNEAGTKAAADGVDALNVAVNQINDNLGQVKNIVGTIAIGASKTIAAGSLFCYLLFVQSITGAGYGAFILQGYAPGTSARNHVATLQTGSTITVTISDNNFIVNNTSGATVQYSLVSVIGGLPSIT